MGKKRKKFSVHQKLICNRSTFFHKAFNGAFKEGAEGIVYLPEDKPDVVEVFIAWLYSAVLNPPRKSSESFKSSAREVSSGSGFAINDGVVDNDSIESTDSKNNSSSKASSSSEDFDDIEDFQIFTNKLTHYMDLYFFAEKYGIESLQNQAMDKLPAIVSGYCPDSAEVREIYENTTESSPLRQFAVKHVAYCLMHSKPDMDFIAMYCELGGDFAKDLVMRLCGMGSKPTTAPSTKPHCYYHVHSDGKRCGRNNGSSGNERRRIHSRLAAHYILGLQNVEFS